MSADAEQKPLVLAMDVTKAAMLAALEAIPDGETVTTTHQEAIAIGLIRAAVRWWVMTTPHLEAADHSFRNGVALTLAQERAEQKEPHPMTNPNEQAPGYRERLSDEDAVILAMCAAHDREESAQKGEPSPWDEGRFPVRDPDWEQERFLAMREAFDVAAAHFAAPDHIGEPTEKTAPSTDTGKRGGEGDWSSIAAWMGFAASVIKSGEPWTEQCQREFDEAKSAFERLNAAPVSGGEGGAVAWRFMHEGGWNFSSTDPTAHVDAQPLYTHPAAPSAMRAALESARSMISIVARGAEDEGDRAYFGSSNHVDWLLEEEKRIIAALGEA